MRALLDTHVLVWWVNGDPRLSPEQLRVLEQATQDQPLWVSDISLWEIATLTSLKRIEMEIPLRDWLERATAPPLVQRLPISPAVAAGVADLPSTFHRDLADRIIVASAQILGAMLLTQDRRIIEAELVPTLA